MKFFLLTIMSLGTIALLIAVVLALLIATSKPVAIEIKKNSFDDRLSEKSTASNNTTLYRQSTSSAPKFIPPGFNGPTGPPKIIGPKSDPPNY